MPQLGEVKQGMEIGYSHNIRYIWHACVDCGKERWVRYHAKISQPRSTRCLKCSRNTPEQKIISSRVMGEHPMWKGGRIKNIHGYIDIRLPVGHKFEVMAGTSGYVPEHRLVMANKLDRCLGHNEIVHHLNGNKIDNRMENLVLVTRQTHKMDYFSGYKEGYMRGYTDNENHKEISEWMN